MVDYNKMMSEKYGMGKLDEEIKKNQQLITDLENEERRLQEERGAIQRKIIKLQYAN